MEKRILVNISHDQLRVVRIEGQKLYDLEIEQLDAERKIDSIWNAEVVSIEPSLEAAFVNFGARRNGFLPLKEIAPQYYPEHLRNKSGKMSIKDILFEGQKILVQVTKEERGTKGAALSTYITLAGCYLVLMPNNPKAGGISRRIEGEDRDILKNTMNALKLPKEMGVIIRTAGIGKSLEELQWDLDTLLNLWQSIQQAHTSYGAPYLIHQESDAAIRVIRDHFRPDIDEVLIDDQDTYTKIRTYIEKIQPTLVHRIKLYTQIVPLFSRFQIEKQIESVFQRKVRLPSGGEIVIDRTEALTAIDVNSAQATKGEYIEETALNTNLEAALEIARQLRIRDLGGLFVIDFIDMEEDENNRKVEDCLRAAIQNDRARIQIIRISRFGLLEMSRQRLRSSLNETAQIICPRCHGQGVIRNIPSQALSIIHLIQENALKDKVSQIQVQVPVNVATYLLNEKREMIKNIEKIHSLNVVIIPNPYIEIPQYKIDCITHGKVEKQTDTPLSYDLLTIPTLSYTKEPIKTVTQKQEPIIKDILPTKPVPTIKARKRLIPKWIKNILKSLRFKDTDIKKETDEIRYKKPYDRRTPTKSRYPGRSDQDRSKRPHRSRQRKPQPFQTKRHVSTTQKQIKRVQPEKIPFHKETTEPSEQFIMVETKKEKE